MEKPASKMTLGEISSEMRFYTSKMLSENYHPETPQGKNTRENMDYYRHEFMKRKNSLKKKQINE